jgi:hypothetical protein
MSELYRVPKHRLPVRLRTREDAWESVHVFLSECADGHAGTEQPEDLFNGRDEFLVVETGDGEVAFLHRAGVSLVEIDLEAILGEERAGADLLAGDLAIEERIRVLLDDGLELEGITRYQRPHAAARLKEHLNAEDPFLPLHRGDRLCLVNKARIARVTPA